MKDAILTEEILLKFKFEEKGTFYDGRYDSPPNDRGFFDLSIEYRLNDYEA